MKNLLILFGLAICLGFSVGCGVETTPASKATGEMKPEDHESQIQDMMDSGKIDPATYGKVQ